MGGDFYFLGLVVSIVVTMWGQCNVIEDAISNKALEVGQNENK